MHAEKEGLKDRIKAEAKSFGILFVYLAVLFTTFTTYRRVLMAEYGISYLHYGTSLFEAFILAKVILLGRMFGLGERYRDRPLIVPTLHKTACFSLLVLAFSIAEHCVSNLLHGKGLTLALDEPLRTVFWEGLAKSLVLATGFIPLFAAWEAMRFLDHRDVIRLFFERRTSGQGQGGMHNHLRVYYNTHQRHSEV